MTFGQFIGLAIFASYFLFIFLLFFIIVQSISERNRTSSSLSWAHIGLTLSSFGYTWYYMISFMRWSFVEYERSAPDSSPASTLVRIANWLTNTALFEQAWTIVCDGPLRWWWSEQLCLFTVGFWTVFLLTRGREHDVKHLWAYMLFGQLVAISVATNLFFIALILPGSTTTMKEKPAVPRRATDTVPPILWLSVLVSLVTVFLVPHSLRHDYFLSNLLAMHALVVIPFIPLPAIFGRLHIRTRTLYLLVGLLSVLARVRTVSWMMKSETIPLWTVLHSHPAQASIGWDVVWTMMSCLVYVCVR